MQLEQLLDCSADKLEAMSDAELLAHFEPFLKVTRPELAEKPRAKQEREQSVMNFMSPEKKARLAALAAEGIDVSFIKHKRKK